MAQLGRRKKCRQIQLDIGSLDCHCFGPMTLTAKGRKELEKVMLAPDELQALIDQDIDDLTMAA